MDQPTRALIAIMGALIGALRVKGALSETEITSIGGAIDPVLTAIGPVGHATWNAILRASERIEGTPDAP